MEEYLHPTGLLVVATAGRESLLDAHILISGLHLMFECGIISNNKSKFMMGCGEIAFGEGGEWNASISLIDTNLLQKVSL